MDAVVGLNRCRDEFFAATQPSRRWLGSISMQNAHTVPAQVLTMEACQPPCEEHLQRDIRSKVVRIGAKMIAFGADRRDPPLFAARRA